MYEHIVEKNDYLSQNIRGFYHCDYTNMRERGYSYFLNELKNDNRDISSIWLDNAKSKLANILRQELPQVLKKMSWPQADVCVVPRAKPADYYHADQLFFSETVCRVATELRSLSNGCYFIKRHTKTKTTHRHFTDTIGSMPYPGISQDTCHISNNVHGRNIILVDDIYTKSINIDEDLIQALLDQGVHAVCLYTVAKTVKKYS
ncbi:MAG: phosphoribosyltransferase [Campylobacterales bacterium]|nr:phosphoribosyltransferase [Campylobacterales bacterium]